MESLHFFLRRPFLGETNGGVVKSRLFSQDIQYVTGLFFSCNFKIILKLFLDHDICQHEKFRKTPRTQ